MRRLHQHKCAMPVKKARKARQPKPTAIIELFIPNDESGPALVFQLDMNRSRDVETLRWWSDVYNGRL